MSTILYYFSFFYTINQIFIYIMETKKRTFVKMITYRVTIPSESVLLNFVKFHTTSLGWIVFPS